MKKIHYLTLFLISSISLTFVSFYSQTSPKKILNNYKFTSLDMPPDVVNHFIIRDSIHQEYSNGKLFAISKVDWLPGNNYQLILRWMTIDVKNGPQPGDTMKLEVLDFINDTLRLHVNIQGNDLVFRYLRSNAE